MLIPSLYATSPRTRSLRPVRVPSDQNTRWRLPFHLTDKRQEFLVSPYLPHIKYIFRVDVFAATPHTCDRMTTPLGTLWTKLCFCLVTVFCFVCVFFVNTLILFIFVHALIYVHALYRTASCITYFNF